MSSLFQGRRWKGRLAVTLLALASSAGWAADFDPAQHADVQALVGELTDRGLDADWLTATLREADFRQEVLDAMSGAAEYRLVWHEYRDIFLGAERIAEGAAFIEEHAQAFARAEAEYGVPAEIIAAILGVETRYGAITGDHRVLDSLATLAFHHPRRGDFFRGELAAFLQIAYEQEVAADSLKGSYAGAMGYPQFIPTSYRAYAVDFNGDGQRNLWHDPVDAIGSVANYFAEHRWQPGEPVYHEARGPASPPPSLRANRTEPPDQRVDALARVGIEPETALAPDTLVMPLTLELSDGRQRYRLARHNFYVITRYNHSHLYAMAVTELAEAIAAARGRVPDWRDAMLAEPEKPT